MSLAKFYYQQQVDMFQFSTISSMAFLLLMCQLASEGGDRRNFFCLLDEPSFRLIKSSVYGGIAHSFNRMFLSGYSKINEPRFGPRAETVQQISCLDFNGMYPSVIVKYDHCMGYPALRTCENNFRMTTLMGKSKIALSWLLWLGRIERQSYIRDALSAGGEKCIIPNGKRFYIDGYEPDTKTVFSFEGCYYHSCKHSLPPDRVRTWNEQGQRSASQTSLRRNSGHA